MHLNPVQIIGFIGKDPERRQARGNGAAFTGLSVVTQRSWKDADDEWASRAERHRVVAGNSLGERVAASLRQGDHVFVEGTLVSSSYEREYGKGKKAAIVRHTVWQVRGDSNRKLKRGEKELGMFACGSEGGSTDGPRSIRVKSYGRTALTPPVSAYNDFSFSSAASASSPAGSSERPVGADPRARPHRLRAHRFNGRASPRGKLGLGGHLGPPLQAPP